MNKNLEYCQEELKYIQSININRVGVNFNYDLECFKCYVRVQAKFANKNNFGEISKQMLSHIGE